MKTRLLLLLGPFLLFCNSEFVKKYATEYDEVVISFQKASHDDDNYWFAGQMLITPNMDTLNMLVSTDYLFQVQSNCEEGAMAELKGNRFLYDLPEYQSQSDSSDTLENHLGGNVYEVDKNRIEIRFFVNANKLFLDSIGCKITLPNRAGCPVVYDEYESTVIVAQIENVKSLTNKDLDLRNLSTFNLPFFTAYYCD